MKPFIPREKLSKKARKELDRQRRETWLSSPVTRTVESKKRYNRKKAAQAERDSFGLSGFFDALFSFCFRSQHP